MSKIKTWNERCEEHPDHQTGMVSNSTIQARMQEEIDELRAALAEPVRQGCDHCNHPLYAAIKCRVCGRVTEPVQEAEPVAWAWAWVASPDGRVIYDDVSADDGLLRVSGDFENDEQRIRYAQRIVDKLNAAPPQRLPLTSDKDRPDQGATYVEGYGYVDTRAVRAVERAHGIGGEG